MLETTRYIAIPDKRYDESAVQLDMEVVWYCYQTYQVDISDMYTLCASAVNGF
jgi:hypothetical protein